MEEQNRLLESAVFEIKNLRRQNQIMSARLTMFDNMMLVLNTKAPQQLEGCSPDLVFEIEKHLTAQKEVKPINKKHK